MKLKYLRVLCLSKYSVKELPKDIGDLVHLRLVHLSHTDITRLPESTSSLYNLLSLKLKGCSRLRTLPTQMRKLVNLRNLDCSGPNKLEVMPAEMGKLISLQKLSNFIVGKGVEQGVGQLKYLSHLKGNISISFLENIRDNQEAREAKLMSKEGLRSLELKWRMDCDDGDLQGTVFAELQPHKHLEKLIINGYGGLSFPVWVGNDRFSKMRVIELANCEKCTSLPPLGKLLVLEEIQIQNMAGIERVGEEFYEKERGAFALLKILKFESMENWSIWWHPIGGGCHFACLQELHVINCPKLSMSLPDGINVQKLVVRECDKLLVALPRQSIFEMDIRECKLEFMECWKEDGDASPLLPSATSLNIEKVDVVEAVGSARMRMNTISNNNDAAHHQMMKLGNLTALVIASIPKLMHLPGVVLQGLPKLETLRICRCAELTSLWKMDGGKMEIGGLILQQGQKTHYLNSLRDLEVKECYQLDCLVPQRGEVEDTDGDTDMISEEEEEDKRGKQQYLGLPCGLETLVLRKCGKLKKLPSDMHNLASLSELVISDCDKLEKLPSDFHNLTSLQTLRIWNCRRLSSLPGMGFPSNLESLFILGCDLLTYLSSRRMPLPHSLKELNIWGCKNLESLVGGTTSTSADSFPSLESVHIAECPRLKCLPESIHRRLKVLCIVGCDNLRELPISVHHLTALEYLRVSGWPAGLLSIQQGGPSSLPGNLRSLEIEGGAGSMTPNPNDDQLFSVPLPSSLTSLSIRNFKRLSPEAFQNLTSLQHLSISYCRELTSIPYQLLPPSLISLEIIGCPLLAPEFTKGKGRYWPKVKFIPRVETDDVRGMKAIEPRVEEITVCKKLLEKVRLQGYQDSESEEYEDMIKADVVIICARSEDDASLLEDNFRIPPATVPLQPIEGHDARLVSIDVLHLETKLHTIFFFMVIRGALVIK